MRVDTSAHAPTPEVKLVEAFQSHCIATVATSTPFKSKLQLRGVATLDDHTHVEVWGLTLAAGADPPRGLEVHFAMRSEHQRMCSASLAFADKAVVIDALKDRLALGEGSTTSRKEATFESESTIWTTRINEIEAVIEFSILTHAGAAERNLTLFVGGRPQPNE
jgi:hypothetical protein